MLKIPLINLRKSLFRFKLLVEDVWLDVRRRRNVKSLLLPNQSRISPRCKLSSEVDFDDRSLPNSSLSSLDKHLHSFHFNHTSEVHSFGASNKRMNRSWMMLPITLSLYKLLLEDCSLVDKDSYWYKRSNIPSPPSRHYRL